jgi:Leucine-rich repeat (LRR) protein
MKRFLTLFLALFILLPGNSLAQQITDGNLKDCIAAAAGKSFDSLSGRELLEITVLECPEKDIASISGIENLANLVELSLNDNRIADISPLAGLDRLTKLNLWHNRIVDISPLAGLKQLKELYLWENQIEDIRPLAKLDMLEELLLGDNRIIDIGPLAGLTRLDYLEIFNNRITDITPLKGLTRLEYLDGSGNSINDVSALLKLGGLTRLVLEGNSITDIKGLEGLKSVRSLSLGYNRINDISSMAKLNELKVVDLSANSIEDITALSNLVNLRRITLDNNLVGNINPLGGLPNLNHVSLLNNCIKDIGAFAQPGIIAGMEYQHDLCSSPNLFRKVITQEWLSEQTGKQCVDYDGENDYSLKGDYEYYPDGIYYNYYIRDTRGTVVRKTACRLPWNSNINDFIMNLEKVDRDEDSFEVLQYRKNHIYVNDGRVKGYSVNNQSKVGGEYSILSDIAELFRVRYSLKKIRSGSYDVLVGKGEGHVIRIVDTGEKYSLQFFEPDFYTEEIAKQQ